MFIDTLQFSRRSRHGQPVRRRAAARTVAGLLWLVVVGSCGCSSIYHQTRAQLPPERTAELSLRLAEAREADRQLETVGRELLSQLRQGSTNTQYEFDRLQTAAHELERRAQAAAAAAQRGDAPAEQEALVEAFRIRALLWQCFVEAERAADPATQEQQLEGLLRSS
jgi:hypothetical protein